MNKIAEPNIAELHKIHADRKQAAADRVESENNLNPIHRIAQTASARHHAETVRIEAEKNRIQAEAEAAARAAAAKPLAKLAAEYEANQQNLNKLTDLSSRRDVLLDQIKVGKMQEVQQWKRRQFGSLHRFQLGKACAGACKIHRQHAMFNAKLFCERHNRAVSFSQNAHPVLERFRRCRRQSFD